MKDFVFTDELRKRIFKHFEGMDEEYEQLIRDYHKIYLNENYTKEYKDKEKLLTIDKVKALKVDRVNKAKEEIEKIKDEYSIKPEPVKYTPEERTANILIWNKVLPTATDEELQELWRENPTDEDLKKLLQAEARERLGKSKTGGTVSSVLYRLLQDIEHGTVDTRFKELDDLVKSLNFIASIDNYPAMIKDSFAGIQYRNVEKDLALYPIDDGPTFRPVFRVTAYNNN